MQEATRVIKQKGDCLMCLTILGLTICVTKAIRLEPARTVTDNNPDIWLQEARSKANWLAMTHGQR